MREHEKGHEEGVVRGGDAPPRRGATMRRVGRARDEYAAAFEQVRLVRAWIAAAAAFVAVVSGCVAVIERMWR